MEIDRDRRVLASNKRRIRNGLAFWLATAFAVATGTVTAPVFAQEMTSAPNSSATSQNTNAPAQVPATLSMVPGTQIQVRTADSLSALDDGYGGHFIGVLVQPVVVDGWVVARTGQYIVGEAVATEKNSKVRLRLNQLILVDGELVRIETAGVAMALNAPPQSLVSFSVTTAASVSTSRGRVAFKPVTAEDYTNFPLGNAPTKIPFGYDPPCCVDQHGYGQFAGDGYGYEYYYGAGYVPPPIQIRYYGWHGNRWGW
jgi:hypothetical protein